MTGVGEPLVRGAASTTPAAPAALLALGRAIERADATARILDAHLPLVRDDPWLSDAEAARLLMRACAGDAAADAPRTVDHALDLLTADRAHPASIAHSLADARDAARVARESLPFELYELLVATRARLPRKVVGPRLGDFLAWVRERSALAVGLIESSVARDGAYELIALGRRLERAAATSRLLAAHADDDEQSPAWMSVLRSAGAHEPHVRAHRGAATAAAAIELLVLDESFPRSVAHSLTRATALLPSPFPPAARSLESALDLARQIASLVEAPTGIPDAAAQEGPRRAASLRELDDAVSAAVRETVLVIR